MLIFLSGKISGMPNYKEQFEYYKYLLEQQGHQVLNPCEIVPAYIDYEAQMGMCFKLIDIAKAVCFLPNWSDSDGSKRENMYAQSKLYRRGIIDREGNITWWTSQKETVLNKNELLEKRL